MISIQLDDTVFLATRKIANEEFEYTTSDGVVDINTTARPSIVIDTANIVGSFDSMLRLSFIDSYHYEYLN